MMILWNLDLQQLGVSCDIDDAINFDTHPKGAVIYVRGFISKWYFLVWDHEIFRRNKTKYFYMRKHVTVETPAVNRALTRIFDNY